VEEVVLLVSVFFCHPALVELASLVFVFAPFFNPPFDFVTFTSL